jgi:xylulokinase
VTQRYILTIDLGTSSVKTALWTEGGNLTAQASEDYPLHHPQPAWAEIDPRLWWAATCNTIRRVLAEAGAEGRDVIGVGVDGLSWCLVAVDGQGAPLHPALIWLDRRAEEEAAWLRGLSGADRLISLAANPLDAAYITPKLVWLQRHAPALFDATDQFLTSSGYIIRQLTGESVCDYTQAYGYHCFDMAGERWDAEAAALVGVPVEKLPRLCAPTAIAGQITEAAASATGLAAGTPVIAGSLDAAAGTLGAGVVRPGQTVDQGGQAGGMLMSVDRVIVEPRLIFSHHILPGQWLFQSGTVGGGSLAWFRDVLGEAEVRRAAELGCSPFDLMSEQAAASPPGSHGLIFLPYMAGERTPLWSSEPRGVFFGVSYSTTRADILRAIMEGCAFAVYHNLTIAEEHGVSVKEWLGIGGAAASATWRQIKADVTNRPFVVATQADGTPGGHSLGLYVMMSHALGLCPDVASRMEELLPLRHVCEPSQQRHDIYEDYFRVYLSLSERLHDDFSRLARAAAD